MKGNIELTTNINQDKHLVISSSLPTETQTRGPL